MVITTLDLIRRCVISWYELDETEGEIQVVDYCLKDSKIYIAYTKPTKFFYKGEVHYTEEKTEIELLDYITWLFTKEI